MLCDLCRAFAFSVLQDDFSQSWQELVLDRDQKIAIYQHGSARTIQLSAEEGCQFCRFFTLAYSWAAIEDGENDPHGDEQLSQIAMSVARNGEKTFMSVPERFRSSPLTAPYFQIYLRDSNPTADGARSQTMHLAQRPYESFDDSSQPAVVRSWLHECETNHS